MRLIKLICGSVSFIKLMSSLAKDIEDMEALFCNSNTPNIDIIRSHSLEILLSLSDSDEFIDAIYLREELLKEILTCLPNAEFSHKALLLLVNLICNEKIANKLTTLGIVSKLYERIFTVMKRVNVAHLICSKSLLLNSQCEVKSVEIGNVETVKTYEMNVGKIDLEEKEVMLELDCIKLSIMCFINLAATSPLSRVEILQKNSAYEANNFNIVMDWVVSPQTYQIFKNFMNVAISISADEDVRNVLITKCIALIMKIANYAFSIQDIEIIEESNKILRNLSFDSNHGSYVAELDSNSYLVKCIEFMEEQKLDSEISVKICRSIIDIGLSVLTSSFAGENPNEVQFFYKVEKFTEIFNKYKAIEAADQYYVDRIECLEHIFSNNQE
jgi:hypothetical protein